MATMELADVLYYALALAVYFPAIILTYAWVADARGAYDGFAQQVKAANSFLGAVLYVTVAIKFPFWDQLPTPWGHVVNIVVLAAFAVASVLLRAAAVYAVMKQVKGYRQRANTR